MCVRVVGSESTSKCFVFDRQDNGTLLSLDTVSISHRPITAAPFAAEVTTHQSFEHVCVCVWFQFGGIIVDVNISDVSTVISFSDYYEGAAPALLLNHTPWVTISYRQRSEVTHTRTPICRGLLVSGECYSSAVPSCPPEMTYF